MNGYDLAYRAALAISAPYWMLKPSARRKVLKALSRRVGDDPPRDGQAPSVMIHAVSLGEMNATRLLVRLLLESRPDLHICITSTTETGFARGMELYAANPSVSVLRYPLDFSYAVGRFLDRQRPSVVVLMELEIWPNFLLFCRRRKIPVLLINGRLTRSSFRNYRLGRFIAKRMLGRLARLCVQDECYAKRFAELGAAPEKIEVTGTMKFDTAQVAEHVEGAAELGAALGLLPNAQRLWVCGSTGPGEEQLILAHYRQLLKRFADLRLVIVPRKPERFDEVARLIAADGWPLLRRSATVIPDGPAVVTQGKVILGDTMGELRKFYSLADIVLVGRTLVDLGSRQHGSDMIEPAALAKPVIVGPYTGNFADAMNALRRHQAIVQITSVEELAAAAGKLLEHAQEAQTMGRQAQLVVQRQQGASARHAERILQVLAVGE